MRGLRAVLAAALLASIVGCDAACIEEAEATRRPRGRRVAQPRASGVSLPTIADPFTLQGLTYASDDVSLGERTELNGITAFSFAAWFRRADSAWGANQTLTARNASTRRQVSLITAARGGSGELRFAVGNGSSLFSCYFPDDTFLGPWYHHVVVTYAAGTMAGYANGVAVTLQNCDTIPTSFPSVTSQDLYLGATASAANRWTGDILGAAWWVGTTLSAEQVTALWAENTAIDYRTLDPAPTWYIPSITDPPVELMVPLSLTVGGDLDVSTNIPQRRAFEQDMFARRVVIHHGTEAWISGTLYAASPSVIELDDDHLLAAYSRGNDHDANHVGYMIESDDEGQTWPLGGLAYPGETHVETAIGHGDLTSSGSSKRSFTLSRINGIGAGGTDRVFLVHNETGFTAEPLERRVWVAYRDWDGADWVDDWSTWYDAPLQGDLWNSVGRAKVYACGDDICFNYYYRIIATPQTDEGRYTAAMARSTDDGATWAHLRNIAQDSNAVGGARYEEPSDPILIDGTYVVFIRVDSGLINGVVHTRDIVRTTSTDLVTWTLPTKVLEGWSQPRTFYRSGDNRLVTIQRFDTTESAEAYPILYDSTDAGLTWTDRGEIVFEPLSGQAQSNARYMQGDFFLKDDGTIAAIFAQDYEALSTTRMWWGVFREENWGRTTPP